MASCHMSGQVSGWLFSKRQSDEPCPAAPPTFLLQCRCGTACWRCRA